MIAEALVAGAAEELARLGADEAGVAALRERYAGVRFTLCSDDDVPGNAKPVIENPEFNVYLVAGSDHCLSLTNDYESGIGVVFATIEPDD